MMKWTMRGLCHPCLTIHRVDTGPRDVSLWAGGLQPVVCTSSLSAVQTKVGHSMPVNFSLQSVKRTESQPKEKPLGFSCRTPGEASAPYHFSGFIQGGVPEVQELRAYTNWALHPWFRSCKPNPRGTPPAIPCLHLTD